MHLSDIFNVSRLEALIGTGHIYCVKHPHADLWLLNYGSRASYDRVWTPETRACRGLIVDGDGQVRARPIEKFFNLGEDEIEETLPERLPAGPFEATVKLDGSMGTLYWLNDAPHIATRGSFTSEQALWATEWVQAHHPHDLPRDLTLIFEIIYPGNRIVVDYAGYAGLILIGVRRLSDGADLDYPSLCDLGTSLGLQVVQSIQVATLADLLALQQTTRGEEGWVVRWPGGFRVKIKTEEYIHLHRLISGLTPKRVQEMLLMGEVDWLRDLPEEHRTQAEQWQASLKAAVAQEQQRVQTIFDSCRHLANDGRKAFAQHVVQQHPDEKGLLFALLDGKDITHSILAGLDAEAVSLI